jgi:hypothetical protein
LEKAAEHGARHSVKIKKTWDSADGYADLDEWMQQYNEQRTHQGRWCFGKTPMQTFLDSTALAREKQNMELAA